MKSFTKYYKIRLLHKSTRTAFGRIGCCHGADWGGYNFWWFGVKYIIALEVMNGWGEGLEVIEKNL